MGFITGDGGFDFTTCFDDQETKTLPLIFAQACFAIAMQREGGNFVLKIFDVFTQATIDVLYLLSCAYSETYICKPQTSRTANSERYVVCKGFIPGKIDLIELRRAFIDVTKNETSGIGIERLFYGKNIPSIFISKVEDYNAIIGQQQLENIHQTLSMIDKFVKPEKIEQMTKQNIAKCINWCMRHQVPYNSITTNIFSRAKESDESSIYYKPSTEHENTLNATF